jgi:hypothetical protein
MIIFYVGSVKLSKEVDEQVAKANTLVNNWNTGVFQQLGCYASVGEELLWVSLKLHFNPTQSRVP